MTVNVMKGMRVTMILLKAVDVFILHISLYVFQIVFTITEIFIENINTKEF